MTRKDYKLIAASIKNSIASADSTAHYAELHGRDEACEAAKNRRTGMVLLAQDLSAVLKAENSRFDYDKFMSACGIDWTIDKVT